MSDNSLIQSDKAQLDRALAGENFCLVPKSRALENFLMHELYWDVEKDGCIEAEYLRKFASDKWFGAEIKKYGFEIQ